MSDDKQMNIMYAHSETYNLKCLLCLINSGMHFIFFYVIIFCTMWINIEFNNIQVYCLS